MVYIVTLPLNSQVMYKMYLAFHVSYEDGTSTSRELYTKCVKDNQAVRYDSKELQSGKCENAQK